MKWIIIIAFFIAIFLFTRCKSSNNYIQYSPIDHKPIQLSFKIQESDSVFQTVTLATTSVEKKSDHIMFLQAHFKGQRVYAEKILTIDLKLYEKNAATGLYDNELFFKNTYVSCDFSSYYYNSYDVGELNYTGNLNDLILTTDLNTKDRINNFYFNKELYLNEYPKEVKVVIQIKWIGGEREFSGLLELIEKKSHGKIRTNPFG